jgi:hypothetical protein
MGWDEKVEIRTLNTEGCGTRTCRLVIGPKHPRVTRMWGVSSDCV